MRKELQELLKKSYSPYSNVKVAAIAISNDGREWKGVNIENATFTPSICAERTAIFSAIASGVKPRDFKELHILSSLEEEFFPCGVCLQVISELMTSDVAIYVYGPNTVSKHTLKTLMPKYISDKTIVWR